jgi:hypothetical protein
MASKYTKHTIQIFITKVLRMFAIIAAIFCLHIHLKYCVAFLKRLLCFFYKQGKYFEDTCSQFRQHFTRAFLPIFWRQTSSNPKHSFVIFGSKISAKNARKNTLMKLTIDVCICSTIEYFRDNANLSCLFSFSKKRVWIILVEDNLFRSHGID